MAWCVTAPVLYTTVYDVYWTPTGDIGESDGNYLKVASTIGIDDTCGYGTKVYTAAEVETKLGAGQGDFTLTPAAGASVAAAILGVWVVAWAFRLISEQIKSS